MYKFCWAFHIQQVINYLLIIGNENLIAGFHLFRNISGYFPLIIGFKYFILKTNHLDGKNNYSKSRPAETSVNKSGR